MIVEQTQASDVQKTYIVKVQYEEDIRRFNFGGSSFAALKEEIYKRYAFKPHIRAVVKYTDDEGDLITITDDTEFADAVKGALNQGTLRLVLSLAKRKVPKEMHREVPTVATAVTTTTTTSTGSEAATSAYPVPPQAATSAYPIAPPPVVSFDAAPTPMVSAATPMSAPLYPTLLPGGAPMVYPPPTAHVGATYVAPPFRHLDRQAKLERMHQWREIKKQKWEQKKAAKMEKKINKQAHKIQKMGVCSQRALARFVKDVGIEDGTELAPSTPFTKIWRFRNEGCEAWPQGSKLMFISWKGGDQMSGPDSVPVPIQVLPGAEVDISIQLAAPVAPGRYAGHYRLSGPDGKKFGDRVRNLIYVVDPSSPSCSSGEDIPAQYAPALAQLEQMGFHHKHWNIKLVKRFHGDIAKIIQKLVNKQKKCKKHHH